MNPSDCRQVDRHFRPVGRRQDHGAASACSRSARSCGSSVSATTRPPRPGEQDGVDYHFLSAEEFERRRAGGRVPRMFRGFRPSGTWYGTLGSEVAPSLAAGKWVVLEIDVQGAMAVLEQYPDAITIFVRPSSTCDPGTIWRSSNGGCAARHRDRGGDPAAAGGGPPRVGLCRPLSAPGRQRRRRAGRPGDLRNHPIPRGVTDMIDELREEEIVNKVGGRFKLSTLIQKRLVALNAGSRPLVDIKTDNKMEIVIQEILQDKIYLDTALQLQGRRRRYRRRSARARSGQSLIDHSALAPDDYERRELVVGVPAGSRPTRPRPWSANWCRPAPACRW